MILVERGQGVHGGVVVNSRKSSSRNENELALFVTLIPRIRVKKSISLLYPKLHPSLSPISHLSPIPFNDACNQQKIGPLDNFIPSGDRRAALLLHGMVFATCLNGYDASIMTTILGDEHSTTYYHADSTKIGTIAVVPWAGGGFAQLFVGWTLSNLIWRCGL